MEFECTSHWELGEVKLSLPKKEKVLTWCVLRRGRLMQGPADKMQPMHKTLSVRILLACDGLIQSSTENLTDTYSQKERSRCPPVYVR
jgi:hypothetical protein